MKTFKTYGAAKRHSNGAPIIKVGKVYLAGDIDSLTHIELIDPSNKGAITGHIIAGHLDRLGNGNWATGKNQPSTRPRLYGNVSSFKSILHVDEPEPIDITKLVNDYQKPLQISAYLQGVNGEEFTLRVDEPEPVEAILDKTIFFPPDAVKAMAVKVAQGQPDHFYVRVVSNV